MEQQVTKVKEISAIPDRRLAAQNWKFQRGPKKLMFIGQPTKDDNPNFTDTGNAKRLSKLFRGNYRYCVETKRWYYWTGARWKACTELRLERLAKAACKTIRNEAAQQSGAEREGARFVVP